MSKSIFLFLFFLVASVSWASLKEWQQLNGPLSGYMTDMIDVKGVLYVSTHYGVFVSEDKGETFIDWGLSESHINTLFSDDLYIFAASLDGKLYRRHLIANEWEELNSPAYPHDITIFRLHSSGLLFAGTDGAGLYSSSDKGNTWIRVGPGIPEVRVNSLLITSTGIIYLGVSYASKIYKSSDLGSTWVPRSSGLSSVKPILSLEETADGSLLAGVAVNSSGGIFRSTNEGLSWYEVYNSSASVFSIFRGSDNFLYAVGRSFFRSTDNGENWDIAGTGLPIPQYNHVISDKYGNIYVLTFDGLYKAKPGTNYSFDKIGLSVVSVCSIGLLGGDLWVGTYDGIYRSSDQGLSWEHLLRNYRPSVFTMLALDDTTLLAGVASNGIYRYKPGKAETALSAELTFRDITSEGKKVLAAAETHLFQSQDGGYIWNQINTAPLTGKINSAVFKGDNIYAGTYGGGVYVTSDSGLTWRTINKGLSDLRVVQLLNHENTLYAATSNGVWIYNHHTWKNILQYLRIYTINRILIKDDELYAASENGVYVYNLITDSLWKQDIGLTRMDVLSLGIDSQGNLLAGIKNGSLMKSTPDVVLNNDKESSPEEFFLHQNYPNPFNPITKIIFTIPYEIGNTKVRVNVYDVLGRMIGNILDEERSPGRHELEFNGNNLSSGTYFYRIIVNDIAETRKMLLLK